MLTDEFIGRLIDALPEAPEFVSPLFVFAREIEKASRRAAASAHNEVEQYVLSVLPSVYYMDPPDGGSVTVLEQLRRMADDAAKYRAILATRTGSDK